jgi:adenylate cyclase class 2
MAKSSRENEIKLAFSSAEGARHALSRAGGHERDGRTFEDNVLFDLADRPLTRAGQILRLRRSGDRAVLTMKTPVEGEHRHKVKNEYETGVGDFDAMMRILTHLGFAPVYRYQKYRTSFGLHGVDAELDETPLGTFIELEGDPEAVDRAARALGAVPADYILASYRELHEQHAAAQGVPVGDLLMAHDS